MANEPRRHHYVPECYQRCFADERKELWMCRKDRLNASTCTPGKFCWEIDANKFKNKDSIIFNDINDLNHIEKNAFKHQENNFRSIQAEVIKFAVGPIIIDKTRYRLFIETLITMKRRNPSTRDFFTKAYRQSYDQPGSVDAFRKAMVDPKLEKEVSDEMILNFFLNHAKHPDRIYDGFLTGFIKKNSDDILPNLTTTLYDLKQMILHAPPGTEFITSDNPGFTKEGGQVLNIGGFGGLFEFYFPISPKTCLYVNANFPEIADIIQKAIYPTLIDESEVSEINQITKAIANERLFGYTKLCLESVLTDYPSDY